MRKVRDEFGGGEAMRPDQVASERVAEWEEFAKRGEAEFTFTECAGHIPNSRFSSVKSQTRSPSSTGLRPIKTSLIG